MGYELHHLLKDLRLVNNLTRKELAYLIDIKERNIISYESENENNRRTPSDQYITAISQIFGVDEMYLNQNAIELFEINNVHEFLYFAELSKFSHSLNKFILFSKFGLAEILVKCKDLDVEDLTLLKSIRKNEKFVTFESSRATLEGEEFECWLHFSASKVIHGINGIKTSDFGLNLDSYINHVDNNILSSLVKLESTGLPLTKEGVRTYLKNCQNTQKYETINHTMESFSQLQKTFNDLTKPISEQLREQETNNKLLDLWQYAPQPVKDKIIALLEKYKTDVDSLDELSGLTPKE